MRWTVLASALCLLFPAMAPTQASEPAALLEAKLYVDDARDLEKLGNLAGDLYICSHGADENGTYLLLVTNAGQLEDIRACGLETRVTWADLDEKFELLTGVPVDDPPRFQDFGYYFTYWEMRDSVLALAAAYPGICSLYTIGTTSQGRAIYCLKISDNASVEEGEPACYFTGSTHGNEPMGTSIVMEYVSQVLGGYGVDPHITWMVDNREIYTVPVLNPDCSVFCSDSSGANVYWRKNRRVVVPPHVGVDPARNYGYRWGCDDIGSSPNPATHAYRGPAPWSDAEASAALSLQQSHRFRTAQNFHCFGGYNCYPWSWTQAAPPEQELLQEMVDTLQMYNGYHDTLTGQASWVLYFANGTQLDWDFADTAGKFVTYSVVIEADTWFWACWNDSALMRLELERNVPTLDYLARVAGTWFDPVAVWIDDTATGNSSGYLDPGETADLWFTIRNRAVHPLDSAYGIIARLVSLDTLVTVPDSVRAFPDVRRRSDVDNRATPFPVLASSLAQPGDTVALLLEVTFTDDGNAMMMPVSFEVVLGGDIVGVGGTPNCGTWTTTEPTVVRDVLFLPRDMIGFGSANSDCVPRPALLDMAGRKVLDLRPGANDVSHLAPGIYFCRPTAGSASSCPASGIRKIVLLE